MTNSNDAIEGTTAPVVRRRLEPIALALIAAGGMTAAIARSDEGPGQQGLVIPPLTAQAHAAGSPAPIDQPGSGGTTAAIPATAQVAQNRPEIETPGLANPFRESFAGIGAAPPSLALERPEPVAEAMVQAAAQLPVEASQQGSAHTVVPESAQPALQLIAREPVPKAAQSEPESAAAKAVEAPVALALAAPAPIAVADAAPAAAIAPVLVPAIAGVEAAAKTGAPAAPVAAAAPVELVPSAQAAEQAGSPAVREVAPVLAEAPKPAFVSNPVVQSLPVAAVAKPIATAAVKPIAPAAEALARPAAKPAPVAALASAASHGTKAKSAAKGQIGGTIASNFQLNDGTIDYKIGARVNGGDPAPLSLRITRDDQLSIKLGDLLGLVKPRMDPALYAYLAASRGAEEYVSFSAIRGSGIDIRYDAARDQLLLGIE